MITQSIRQKQVTRTLRAIEQRANYSLRLGEIRARVEGREERVRVVFVTNVKSGACYTVRFRRQGVPVCNCEDGQRVKRSGTCLKCKHTVLAEEFVGTQTVPESRGDRAAQSEPRPAAVDTTPWPSAGDRLRTAEERREQALLDRLNLWPD